MAQGNVTIEGDVVGDVAAEGALQVGAEANLKANVRAVDAVVAGSIEGSVTVTKQLELKSTARVIGDVTCESISVETGAVIQGNVSVGAREAAV